MFETFNFLFITVTLLYLLWIRIIAKSNSIKTIYFLYFFFNFTVFYGPIIYYRLGFTAYSNVVSNGSLEKYHYIAAFVAVINIIVYLYIKNQKLTIFYNYFKQAKYDNIINKKIISHFYLLVLIISISYIYIYRNFFPLISLINTGELGERLDATGSIPLYITFSSLFIVLVPSAFLYFQATLKNKYLNIVLFIFTVFCLSAGGNKGIVSFFLIFYVLFCTKGNNIFKYVGLILVLAFIYAVFKGITSYDENTLNYLLESPFRRLFAAQGSGYIARLEMMDHNMFLDGHIIKHQVYSLIYNQPLGTGSSPTHFTGDLIVEYGYFYTIFFYIIYLIIFVRLLYTSSVIYNDKNDAFLLWSFFIIAFITTNSDINVANFIRTGLVIINFTIVRYAAHIKK